MRYTLYTQIALAVDLRRGDIATIADRHPTERREGGYSLEIFNAVGDTISVVVVPESAIALWRLMKCCTCALAA